MPLVDTLLSVYPNHIQFRGRYESIAHLMGPEAKPKAIYCFLKNYVAPAAQELKASESDEQTHGRGTAQQDEASNDQLTSARRPLGIPTPEAESFGHKVDEDVYRCMLCLRQFSGDSSLKRHESLSEMHRSNLENPTLVATARSRLANIFRPTAT